jgi:hypothetical protein
MRHFVGVCALALSLTFAVTFAVTFGVGHPAAAQQSGLGEGAEQAAERAFDQMFADPANLDKTFAFAEAAVRSGDLEGAVAALERMLLINRKLPRVRLELGVLYFRLKSYEAAREQLVTVLAMSNIPAEVNAQAASILASVDHAQSLHRVSGFLYGGLRSQTNANTGSSGGAVKVFGFDGVLDNRFTAKNDWNAFVSAKVAHEYDFRNQDETVLNSQFQMYGTRHHDQTRVEIGFFEVESGPTFQVETELFQTLSIRPYLVGDMLAIDDVRNFASLGLGLNFDAALNNRLSLRTRLRAQDRRYRNSGKRPTNDNRDGVVARLSFELTFLASTNVMLNGIASITNQNAKSGSEANKKYTLGTGLSYVFRDPFFASARNWIAAFNVRQSWTNYEDADPVVDPNNNRDDQILHANMVTNIPIDERKTIILSVTREIQDSSLPNFKYTNSSASVGLLWTF